MHIANVSRCKFCVIGPICRNIEYCYPQKIVTLRYYNPCMHPILQVSYGEMVGCDNSEVREHPWIVQYSVLFISSILTAVYYRMVSLWMCGNYRTSKRQMVLSSVFTQYEKKRKTKRTQTMKNNLAIQCCVDTTEKLLHYCTLVCSLVAPSCLGIFLPEES